MMNVIRTISCVLILLIISGCNLNSNIDSLKTETSPAENSPIASPIPIDSTQPPEQQGQSVIYADEMSTCLLQDKKLICSGENAHYEKLTGDIANVNTPLPISSITEDILSYEAGTNFTCVLLSSRKVKCWGTNDLGQLGDGTNISSTTPVEVLNLENVSKITLGWKHACALLLDGGVKCWGDNNSGELGRGFTNPSGGMATPDYVSGLNSGVSDISSGSAKSEHTCALIADSMKCWGMNSWGQLGDGTQISRRIPTDVLGLGTGSGVIKLVPSRYSSCAVLSGNRMKCWGENTYGQLGNSNLGVDSLTPVDVILSGLASNESVIDAGQGEDQVCLLTDKGSVYCWGRDNYGQLGDGTIGGNIAQPTISLLTSGVKQLSVGRYHSCVIMESDEEARCWGLNTFGQLGQGNTTNSAVPLKYN